MPACVENIHEPQAVNNIPTESPAVHPTEQQPADQPSAAQQNAEPQKTSANLARWFGFGKSRAAKLPHIVHVDVDAFFASVEQVLNPRLRGKPVLVGRGVVASASYEAKSRGVKTAMSFREALGVCPNAIVVPGQYEHYADFAERVRRILDRYTPAVETAALDDFYLDFTGAEQLYPDYEATLRRIQNEIMGRTGLSVSIGAGCSKVVASIASRLQRPKGFRIVPCGEEKTFLAPLPVEKIHGISHMHGAILAGRGIATIGELRQVPRPALRAVFGEAIGQQIWERARGLDGREVLHPATPKSISRETIIEGGTFDTEFLSGLTEYLSERIGSTLREYGKQAHTIGLRVSYIDHFSAHQAVRIPQASNDQRKILAAAKDLFKKLFTRRVPVRLIGINASHFEADKRRHKLFATNANRPCDLNRSVDSPPDRYGWNAVFCGTGLELPGQYQI